jgi:DNA-binding transcriptional LysR family regulator
MPVLKEFLSRYSDIQLDVRLSDAIVDLVEGGFDVAIRNAELKNSSLIARKLAPDNRILCASPDYLKEYGKPKTLDELKTHQCIQLMGLDTW